MYQALKERGYWIAEHHANKSKVPEGLRMYLLDGTERIHGHIQNVCGNGLIEKLTTYQSLQGNFRFIREII